MTVGEDGCGRLPNGKLAGSSNRMNVLVGNLIEMMKLPLATAINAATINPAKRMGFARKGLIEAGYDADLCVLNNDYSVAQTWVLGEAMLRMSKARAVFFDIDHTLFSHTLHDVPASAYTALEKLKQNGSQIALCTSRAVGRVVNLPPKLTDLLDGVVCAQGGIIMDHGKIIASKIIDEGDAERVIDYCRRNNSRALQRRAWQKQP